MDLSHVLPAVNACLNGIAGVFLIGGYLRIRRGDREGHQRAMVAATAASTLFLLVYVISKLLYGTTLYQGTGWIRTVYFVVLFSHLTLAMVIVPLAALTLWHAFTRNFARHRRIARWTLPLWLYVSVTGILVYLLLRPYY